MFRHIQSGSWNCKQSSDFDSSVDIYWSSLRQTSNSYCCSGMLSANISQHLHKNFTLSVHNFWVRFKLVDSGVDKSVYLRNSMKHVTPFSVTFLQIDVEGLNDLLLDRLQYVACTDLSLFSLLLFQRILFFESEFWLIIGTALNSRRLAGNLNSVHEHWIWRFHLGVMGGANSAPGSVRLQNLVAAMLTFRLFRVERIYDSEILHHIVVDSLFQRIFESKLCTRSLRRVCFKRCLLRNLLQFFLFPMHSSIWQLSLESLVQSFIVTIRQRLRLLNGCKLSKWFLEDTWRSWNTWCKFSVPWSHLWRSIQGKLMYFSGIRISRNWSLPLHRTSHRTVIWA